MVSFAHKENITVVSSQLTEAPVIIHRAIVSYNIATLSSTVICLVSALRYSCILVLVLLSEHAHLAATNGAYR